MTGLKNSLDKLSFPDDISSQWPGFSLKWAEQTAGFDIFDLTGKGGGKLSIGDDADFLKLFMTVSEHVYQADHNFSPLLLACDMGGKRLFARHYTTEDKEKFKYAYLALGNAAKDLPPSAINEGFSFFAEISLEKASVPGFEKEARKAARVMSGDEKEAWESLIKSKDDFLKTDLYVFQLLKLYSWGFTIINQDGNSSHEHYFVRAKRPQPRGASRN